MDPAVIDPVAFSAAFLVVVFTVAGFDLLYAFIMRVSKDAPGDD